jgi:thiamine-monophosphate kinase
MLISFSESDLEAMKAVAKETNTPLTVFARVVKNSERFRCDSHHF